MNLGEGQCGPSYKLRPDPTAPQIIPFAGELNRCPECEWLRKSEGMNGPAGRERRLCMGLGRNVHVRKGGHAHPSTFLSRSFLLLFFCSFLCDLFSVSYVGIFFFHDSVFTRFSSLI